MKKIFLSTLILLVSLLLTSCDRGENLFYRYEYNGYLDTVGYVIVEYNSKDYSRNQVSDILAGLDEVLLNIEKEFSIGQTPYMLDVGIEKSTLMLINEHSGKEKIKVSNTFLELLEIALKMAEETNGLFDPTIGSLTKLWNISSRAEYCMDNLESMEYLCRIPTEAEIQEVLPLVNYQLVEIDKEEQTVYLPIEGMMLDLGAVGKGFGVEKMSEYLEKYHFSYTIINMGGNVKIKGEPLQKVEEVKLYVNNPFEEGNVGYYYPNENTGGVTSGIYERYIYYQDVKYHHILNPDTGYPCSDEIVSVTIMGENSSISDALSTGVFALGLDAGLALINSLEDYEAVIITNNKQVYVSNNLDFIQE